MVAVGRGIRTAIQIAGKIDKKYNINKIFIEKYVPPGYRRYARAAFDIAGTAGLVVSGLSYISDRPISDDGGGTDEDGSFSKQTPPSKYNKTYRGRSRRTYNRYNNKYCPRPRRRQSRYY